MSKKIKKNLIIRRLIIVIFIILIICIINKVFFTAKEVKYDEPVLMVDANFVDLKDNIIIDSIENIYLSMNDIKTIYEQEMDYNEETKALNISYENHKVTLKLDSNEIKIDGNERTISGRMQFSSGNLYLPFSDFGDIYNFEITYSAKTNIVILDNISDKKETAVAKKYTYVKDDRSFFAKKITKLLKDEKVTILEKYGNYYKIRTKDGIIGYVKSKKII